MPDLIKRMYRRGMINGWYLADHNSRGAIQVLIGGYVFLIIMLLYHITSYGWELHPLYTIVELIIYIIPLILLHRYWKIYKETKGWVIKYIINDIYDAINIIEKALHHHNINCTISKNENNNCIFKVLDNKLVIRVKEAIINDKNWTTIEIGLITKNNHKQIEHLIKILDNAFEDDKSSE